MNPQAPLIEELSHLPTVSIYFTVDLLEPNPLTSGFGEVCSSRQIMKSMIKSALIPEQSTCPIRGFHIFKNSIVVHKHLVTEIDVQIPNVTPSVEVMSSVRGGLSHLYGTYLYT